MGGTSATGGQGGVFGTVIGALINITVLIDLQFLNKFTWGGGRDVHSLLQIR